MGKKRPPNVIKNPSEWVRKNAPKYSSPFTQSPSTDQLRVMEAHYVRNLTEWSTTRFDWDGLPETVDGRHLETELFYRGLMVFYHDKRYGKHMCVRAVPNGFPDIYYNPVSYRTIDMNLYKGLEIDAKECVPIWGSYTRKPEVETVILYAGRLAEIDTSIRVVSKNMRVNKVISARRSQQLSMQNIQRQIDAGVNVVYADENFDMQAIQALDLGIHPQVLPALRIEKNHLWNECMTMLGIENANQDKKERLVVDEVNSNNGQIMVARNSAMKVRREAAEKINEMFNLNISVDWAANEIIREIDLIMGTDPDDDVDDDKDDE